ncbi:MAG: hypothetical protein V5A72_00685, partial [Candidatus Nanohaloarchaea archaeon]
RDFKDAKEFIQNFLDDDIQKLKLKGVPSHIADRIIEYNLFDVLEGDEKWLNYLAEELNL